VGTVTSLDAADVTARRAAFREELISAGILIDTGVRGVFGRGSAFEGVIRALERVLDGPCGEAGAERVYFPPLTPSRVLQQTGFVENFPNLCGWVHAFDGDEVAHRSLLARASAGEDWSDALRRTETALTPAACYPLYPTLSGTLPAGGRLFDFTACCFRHEPSDDPARMQAFQVRENVRLGDPDSVRTWREGWMERALALIESLELPARIETAHDPFFGRGGRMMAAAQLEDALKFELLVPIWAEDAPTAVASFNYHRDHFSKLFDIRMPDGDHAHSACLGFGLDRIGIALFRFHGLDPQRWPEAVRRRLSR
jgi:seryl-tRNA synthetase